MNSAHVMQLDDENSVVNGDTPSKNKKKSSIITFQKQSTKEDTTTTSRVINPSPYSGLHGFHKYWGKKPVEPLKFLISVLTELDDLIVDPFLGSGAIAREAVQLGRRFVGSDVNPIAINLARFSVQPCTAKQYADAIAEIERTLRSKIEESYKTPQSNVASHFLWEKDKLLTIWQKENGKRSRKEIVPTSLDTELALSFESYIPQSLRPLRLFHNSRINSSTDVSWNTLFSGRALRNIELLRDKIRMFPFPVRQALELTLTAAAGQMSKMVFAITSRGKTKGSISNRIEVGSWVIGYWCPETHFEVNVWNCFESKAKKLQKALSNEIHALPMPSSIQSVIYGESKLSIETCEATELVKVLPVESIDLLITDPPHGDRIPYLELSEMWNAVIDKESCYQKEIVVSNAKGRNKTPKQYQEALNDFFFSAIDRLSEGAYLVLFFNSRHDDEWLSIREFTDNPKMTLLGCFPLEYSATSVVQDNRAGSMKNDYILVYVKGKASERIDLLLKTIPNWQSGLPE
jgi:hypothetical protein